MKCQYCGLNTDLPFRCPFCGGYFCAEHRLPEFHACQGIKRGVSHPDYLTRRFREEIKARHTERYFSRFLKYFSHLFRSTELIHISLGALMVILVGFSIAIETRALNLQAIPLFAFIFVLTFVLHELAHKFTAKYYGLWAEFRLSLIGIIVTLISILSPIKIISPGAVIISGEATRENIGKISLSGPLVNLSLATIFLALSSALPSSAKLFEVTLAYGAMINAIVALFNLIPFGALDGAKILWWNKYFWTVTFLVSLVLVAVNLYPILALCLCKPPLEPSCA
ncbi:MAG: AN1-type zinc finger domain-containing protein [Candidatus Bathyarchaeia archaeon]